MIASVEQREFHFIHRRDGREYDGRCWVCYPPMEKTEITIENPPVDDDLRMERELELGEDLSRLADRGKMF
jgi:hypothetical protein